MPVQMRLAGVPRTNERYKARFSARLKSKVVSHDPAKLAAVLDEVAAVTRSEFHHASSSLRHTQAMKSVHG